LRDQINSAIHVLLQIDRFVDGTRRVSEVAAVASNRRETFRLATVARFEPDPIEPGRRVTGRVRHFALPPAILRWLELQGQDVPDEVRAGSTPEREAG
jgi:pilus assembly protein CpaF